jgi:hypothetical protein
MTYGEPIHGVGGRGRAGRVPVGPVYRRWPGAEPVAPGRLGW